jgi:2-isopropylmalate synthase
MAKDQLIIFDTTLRDGEQSPGASMTKEEKLRIARQLERMRVDVIEAGFPAASNGDFEAVKAVAEAIKESTVAGLCRAFDKDIARALEAVKPARSGRIHTFIATSPIHMEKKLRMAPDDVLVAAQKAVRFARNGIDDVEFSCEDAGRSDLEFLCRIIEAVIKEGSYHHQHSGHGGLQRSRAIRGENSATARADSGFGQSDLVSALPQ